MRNFILALLGLWLSVQPCSAAFIDAPYLTVGTDTLLGRYRTIATGNNVFGTDSGAKSNYTLQTFPHSSISSSPTTLTGASNTVQFVTTGASTFTLNLPAASSNADKHFVIKKVDSGAGSVVITPNGTDKIDGASTYTASTQYQTVEIQSDGVNWFVCALNSPGTGTGTVTSVTFTGDGIVDSSTPSAAVTTSGTVTATAKTQTANTVLSGPTSGGVTTPTFRALVGADLPNPAATTLGGVESLASSTSKWINPISTSGVPSATQPAFTDISGSATATQTPGGPGVFQARLTGFTGIAITNNTALSGQTSAGTLYLTPYQGNQVSVYDGSKWITDKLTSDASLLLGATGFTVSSGTSGPHTSCSDGTDIWFATGTTVTKLTLATGVFTSYSVASANAHSVCLGLDNKIWYSTQIAKIGRINLDGTGDTEFTTTSSVNDVCPGPADGNTWYGTSTTKIGKIATGGTGDTEFTTTSAVQQLCVGLDNLVWYSTGTTKIGKCTTGGTVTEYATTTATFGVAPGPSDGNTWYGTSTTKIGKIATGGTGDTEFTTTSAPSSGVCAVGSNMWYLASNTKIGKITTSGTGDTEFASASTGSGTFLFNGNLWAGSGYLDTTISSELASGVYDIWVRDVSGTLTLDDTVWTNTTTRATALDTQDGVLVKSGDATRRYVGTVYIPGSNGSSADIPSERFIWNYYNRVNRSLFAQDPTASWTYAVSTVRASDTNTTDGQGRVSYVVGVSEDAIHADFNQAVNANSGSFIAGGVGIDSTTTYTVKCSSHSPTLTNGIRVNNHITYDYSPSIGQHFIQCLEGGETSTNATIYGTNDGSLDTNSWLTGTIRN